MHGDAHAGCGGRARETHREQSRQGAPVRPNQPVLPVAADPILQRIDTYLMRWAGKKYRRLRPYKRFKAWWSGLLDREPRLFGHWAWGVDSLAGMR